MRKGYYIILTHHYTPMKDDRTKMNCTEKCEFVDDIKKKHGGDIVFVAMSIQDYEHMAHNTQELKRYINQLGEVIVYYRNVTINDKEAGAVEIKVEEK